MDGNSDIQAALGGAPTQQAPTPGPAATSLDPAVAAQQGVVAETPQPGQIGAVQMPQQQAPQQPVQQQTAPPQVPQQFQQPQQQQVAPNAPNAQPFINPDPSSAISEPAQFDAQGQPVPVTAPANQPAPIHPQVAAQEQHQRELNEPPTVEELAECANTLRSAAADKGGAKVAALLDRVAEARIQAEQQQSVQTQQGQSGQIQAPQQFQQQPPQPPQQFGQGVQQQQPPQGPFVTR